MRRIIVEAKLSIELVHAGRGAMPKLLKKMVSQFHPLYFRQQVDQMW